MTINRQLVLVIIVVICVVVIFLIIFAVQSSSSPAHALQRSVSIRRKGLRSSVLLSCRMMS
jgi:hypothetical protein